VDSEALHEREGLIALTREVQLSAKRFRRTYDLRHVVFLHRWLFRDVYDWAGNVRTIPIHKGASEFAQPQFIDSEAARIFKELHHERNLAAVRAADLPGRLTYYFGELNALHPFREGNGRVQRLFFRHLLDLRGARIRWTDVSAKEMVAVSVAVHNGDEEPLRRLFARIVQGG
jgi:cell filamentation protein